MALSFIYAKLSTLSTMNFEFTLVEPHKPMRDVAGCILTQYKASFDGKSKADTKFKWNTVDAVDNIKSCAAKVFDEKFDLILFSHTFDVYEPNVWAEMKKEVVTIAHHHLAPGGMMLFLTPKDSKKITQVNDLTLELSNMNFGHFLIVPAQLQECYKAYACPGTNGDLKHPKTLIDTRSWFIEEGKRLGVEDVFKAKVEDDRPYYWFNCQVDVVVMPSSNAANTESQYKSPQQVEKIIDP